MAGQGKENMTEQDTIELKTAWSEDYERFYSLHRVAGKTIRIRGVFGRRLIAEIFSPALSKWELMTMTVEPVPGWTQELVDLETAALLDEARLILGYDVMIDHRKLLMKYIQYIIEMEGTDYLGYDDCSTFSEPEWNELRRLAIKEVNDD
jgi:hypothetical protein